MAGICTRQKFHRDYPPPHISIQQQVGGENKMQINSRENFLKIVTNKFILSGVFIMLLSEDHSGTGKYQHEVERVPKGIARGNLRVFLKPWKVILVKKISVKMCYTLGFVPTDSQNTGDFFKQTHSFLHFTMYYVLRILKKV